MGTGSMPLGGGGVVSVTGKKVLCAMREKSTYFTVRVPHKSEAFRSRMGFWGILQYWYMTILLRKSQTFPTRPLFEASQVTLHPVRPA